MDTMNDAISDDSEMECDFIQRPSSMPKPMQFSEAHVEQSIMERPTTPPNSFLSDTSVIASTPSNNDSDGEPFFLRRVGLDRHALNRHRFTSTPLLMGRLSNTLPHGFPTSHVSNSTDLRQCRSVENVRLKIGPEEIPYEYINPFTPDGKLFVNKSNAQKRLKRLSINPVRKFDLSDSTESDELSITEGEVDIPTRPRLSEFNVFRFNEEFLQMKEIGKGVHGFVYKCLNRINGCIYAIKRTKKPIKSSIEERVIRNEIYAHGILDHHNIVRNFSCWKEDGYVFIQNEYCNGGSLEDYIKTNAMSEARVRSLLLQMAHALRYIHRHGLAHMDVKPENIMLCIDRMKENSMESDGGFADDEKLDDIVFKLGDLGHITKLDEENDVEEGDCRYLPREILEEKYKHLDRADIFALGLTVYEAAGGGPLAKNGDEWQEIRNGNLKKLDHLSEELNTIIKKMVQPAPELRPSAAALIQDVKPTPPPSPPDDVMGYLQHYRNNNSLLEHKVETAGQYLKVLFNSHKQLQEKLVTGPAAGTRDKRKGTLVKTRVIGKKTKRSTSTTLF